VIIPHAAPLVEATQVRSTLLQSSLATIRGIGRFEEYVSRLDAKFRDAILHSLAPVWLPIEVGRAHYQTCDALRLTDAEILRVGEAVGDRIQGVLMTTLTRAARNTGVTPWVLLRRFDRLWQRLFRGGSVEVVKTGPKDLTVEVRKACLTQFEYFRVGFCGVVRAGFKVVGVRTAYVKIVAWGGSQDRFVIRAAWV
jgi:hypothetical protein